MQTTQNVYYYSSDISISALITISLQVLSVQTSTNNLQKGYEFLRTDWQTMI